MGFCQNRRDSRHRNCVVNSRPITVLLVGKDPDVRDLTAELLQRADPDLTVVTESDPVSAATRTTNKRIDCVISDYRMTQGRVGTRRSDHHRSIVFLLSAVEDEDLLLAGEEA